MKILTSPDDDFLYNKFIDLLKEIRLVQGATALTSTIRRHPKIKRYLLQKQVDRLGSLESIYFDESGYLDEDAIDLFHQK